MNMNANDTVLESFMNFCDDMQIAEEGFGDKIKNTAKIIWQKIKTLINKIVVYTKSRGGKILIPQEVYIEYNKMTKLASDLIIKFETNGEMYYLNRAVKEYDLFEKIETKLLNLCRKYATKDFNDEGHYLEFLLSEAKADIKEYTMDKEKYENLKKQADYHEKEFLNNSSIDDSMNEFRSKYNEMDVKKIKQNQTITMAMLNTSKLIENLNSASKLMENMIKSDKNDGYDTRLEIARMLYDAVIAIMKCSKKPNK